MKTPYSYVVVQYVPDVGAAEALNIGVVVYAKSQQFLRLKVDSHYERLSQAFAGFDGATFRRAVANLLYVFRDAERSFAKTPLFVGDGEFGDWLRSLMPDVGASFSFTDARHGISADVEREATLLFDRMVESLKAHADERPRRDDMQVWRSCAPRLSEDVVSKITKRSFANASVKVDFDHAVKNGRWHVIQPISMDFKRADSMQRKASQWVGTTIGLKESSDFGSIIFVMGKPSASQSRAFQRAKALLGHVVENKDIIDETEADRLDRRLRDLLSETH